MMLSMRGCNILIANPRDLPAMFKDTAREVQLPGRQHAVHGDGQPRRVRHGGLGSLVISVGGGMAQANATKLWLEDRLPDRGKATACRNLTLHLQPGGQHRLQRQHQPAHANTG